MDNMFSLVRDYGVYILGGTTTTLELTGGAVAISIVIGLVVALARLSNSRLLSLVAASYVEIIRNTPALLQLFIVYFGLAGYGVKLDPLTAGIISLGIIGGAYLAEIFRAGIQSIDRGQIEAGMSIGMRGTQVMRRVIIPQAAVLVLPPSTNFLIGLIKDTSLLLTISLAEITYRAYNVAAQTFQSMNVYLIAGVIYFMICFPLSRVARRMEGWTAR